MKKLLVFSDLQGTIDEGNIEDFINLFGLIEKYCEKKGYDGFSFNIVTGAGDIITTELYSIFLQVKQKIDKEIEFSIFSGLLPGEKKGVIDSLVSSDALPVGYNISKEEEDDILIAKEVIYFDDYPHRSLRNPSGKNYFESKYDIEYQCVIPAYNIGSVMEHFELALTNDEGKKPLEKTSNQTNN